MKSESPQQKLGQLNLENKKELKRRLGKGEIKTHISLFTGCGGLDVGFGNAGIQTRIMIEFEKNCCETLRGNFHWEGLKERKKKDGKPRWKNKREMKKDIFWYHEPEPVIFERDIKEVTTEEILEAAKLKVGQCSIISGGFPCQGFSLAGRRVINDPRNQLYKEFVRIVDEIKPAMIFGENVPGLVSMGKGEVMKQICEDFANCGYDITWDILDVANYGVPQHRKRIILIGNRIDIIRFKEDGSMAIYLGATPGKIEYPQLFYDRLKRWKNKKLLDELNKLREGK